MQKRKAKLSELSEIASLNYFGEDIYVNGLGLCNRSSEYDSIVSYLTSANYVSDAVKNRKVRVIIVSVEIYEQLNREHGDRFSYIVSEKPEDDFYSLHKTLYQSTCFYDHYDRDSVVGQDCNIHSTAIIESGVTIGDRVEIGAYTVISSGSSIGNDCHIGRLSVIGSQGFQAVRRKDGSAYNPIHVGGTIIGNNVWVGDNVTVCNALFEGNVLIGDSCMIDNHTQVAHNCIIGKNNILTCGVIMFGSSEIKENCWLAPGSMVMNRVVVEDRAFIGANSTAQSTVPKGTTIIGTPGVALKSYVKKQLQIDRIIKELNNGK